MPSVICALEQPVKSTLKLFPGECVSEIRWVCVPNCWSAHAETAAVKLIRLVAWYNQLIQVVVIFAQQHTETC